MQKLKFKSSEIVILVLVSLMSFAANLPDNIAENYIDRKLLLLVLAASVVIALFRYLRVMLFLAIIILALGANLPHEFAESMGFSPTVMLIVLGALVSVSLLNYAFRLLPTGAEERTEEAADSRYELLSAITRGDQAAVFELLNLDAEINFSEDGQTPLHLAVTRGYPDIVRMLVNSGADIEAVNEQGKTPIDIALEKRFIRSSEILFKAAKFYAEQASKVQAAPTADLEKCGKYAAFTPSRLEHGTHP
ncbi:MAG TPA: ankyrin repeat domain-containing protein [Gallionellaceae bacterium]|nr:ankyrin repeat domain-containing protein [Gallionellaceae bacterium]